MKAIVYTSSGGADVLTLTDRPVPEPAAGEVRVKVEVSGVNPTDWKARQNAQPDRPQVPNQDGSGVIDAVGAGVPAERVGERVWLWESAYQRPDGTAQEFTTVPARQAVRLPDHASFDLGASVGVPALTAHRALTVADDGPRRLAPGTLDGRTVLVAGGAGAVGNAAIQLARWAGATVITTVSGPEKAALATAAGAHHVVNYREQDAAAEILRIAPDGVHVVVEVAPDHNATLDAAVVANNAVVAFYADDGHDFAAPVRRSMTVNLRWQGLLLYTMPTAAKDDAVAAVSAALADGALRAGPEAGLPFHRFPLERTGAAHEAVRNGAVGKVLIDVASA
ncbi:NADPH:quinone reductase [Actinacidiphila yanglinensis]|uniref:NADPH:quinone reductase n=1 Tax=Actinacidiphila yanglinensis TaxID=310779 RepID=A0A1H5T713_9ACTN|nr:NADPH:quinone reductase [Actinacidiphila yanglinensis]SEF58580.1 NADPH:quinone reductase [Actinacidiphila yanglinensis]